MPESAPRSPSETKLLICVNNPAPLWNPPPDAAERMRARFPQLRIAYLPDFTGLERELPDTNIFMGHALNAARLALHGDGSHFVSLDQVIRTMRDTGRDMLSKYKETSQGGLAVNAINC